ncbi:hypothetical protein FLP41_09450 [Paracoccus marcusii]|nr:hypothetical protein FLP41_09450 [Paracoccus marcusii]
MSVPDFALRRPVFATVINLLIVLIGRWPSPACRSASCPRSRRPRSASA